jgi:hypothetical protein
VRSTIHRFGSTWKPFAAIGRSSSALQDILEKSVRELGAISRVDCAARVSLTPALVIEVLGLTSMKNGRFVAIFLQLYVLLLTRFSGLRRSI